LVIRPEAASSRVASPRGHADPEHDAADLLAPGHLRVEDPPRAVAGDEAPHAELAQIGVDRHLGEVRAEGVHGDGDGCGVGLAQGLDRSRRTTRGDIRAALRARGIAPRSEHPVQDLDARGIEAAEGRPIVRARRADDLAPEGPGHRGHRRRHARRRHRPSRARRLGQGAIAHLEAHVVHGHPEHFRGDLAHDGIRAGAEVVRGRLDDHRAVCLEHRAGGGALPMHGYVALAMPHPMSQWPSRIDRGSGRRPRQPNRSAPTS
jgi:hypothetical protein